MTKEKAIISETQQVFSTDTHSPNLEIDWEQLHQLSEGDAKFELELLQMFGEDTQVGLAAIKVAIANNDFVLLQHKAHQIKGASANIGATAIHLDAEQLEHRFSNRRTREKSAQR